MCQSRLNMYEYVINYANQNNIDCISIFKSSATDNDTNIDELLWKHYL